MLPLPIQIIAKNSGLTPLRHPVRPWKLYDCTSAAVGGITNLYANFQIFMCYFLYANFQLYSHIFLRHFPFFQFYLVFFLCIGTGGYVTHVPAPKYVLASLNNRVEEYRLDVASATTFFEFFFIILNSNQQRNTFGVWGVMEKIFEL